MILNCLVCSKEKKDHDVWTNKTVIGALYDSEFQNHEIIRSMTYEYVICHDCMNEIQKQVEMKRK